MDLLRKMLHDAVAELDREQRPPASRSGTPSQREAVRFLRELDPGSQEGLWFEALAEGFPSRIDAAIAYLRDVKPPR